MGSNYVLFPYMRRWKGKPRWHQDLRGLEGESAHLAVFRKKKESAPCAVMELRYSQSSCSQQAHGNFHRCAARSAMEGYLTLLMYLDSLEILTFPARNRFGADKKRQWQDQNTTHFFSFPFPSSFKPQLGLQIPKNPLNQGHVANRIWANVQICLSARLLLTIYDHV